MINLQKSVIKRPDLYDAYFGFGLYHYWRSALTGVLRFLPLVPDQRRQGINEIRLAIEKGRYAGVEGQFALENIFYNEAEYDSALLVNDWLYQRFPHDPSALYMRARIYQKQQDWQNLLTTTETLYATLMSYPYKSIGYQIECHYLLAVAHDQLGQKELAYHHLEMAQELKKKRDKKTELEGPLEDFDQVFDNVKKLAKQIDNEQRK